MWIGLACFLILVVTGMGMYFTGRCMGIEWVLTHTRIEYVGDDELAEDEEDGES